MRRRKALRIGTAVLFSGLLIFSGAMIWKELSARQKEKEEFAALAEMVEAPNEPASQPSQPESTDEPEESEPSENLRDLSGLFAQNDDCIGWLCIPDTQLNYPVMHTPEDPQKYLRRSFYGEYSQSGVPFLDCRCGLGSDNLIIYGHNMKNGTMFGGLKNYLDRDFCAAHPVIELQTESGLQRYTVFAVAAVRKIDPWYDFLSAADAQHYTEMIEYIRGKAVHTADISPVYGSQLLTLSTCYGSGKDGRLLVVGVKQ